MAELRGEHPGYVCEHIHEALAQDRRVGELDVRVRLVGDQVFLSGRVTTEERRRVLAEVVAEHLPGVEIRNDVDVVSGPDEPRVETVG